jgi:molybdopterin-guanine dinucleotide biosynthesis protein A
MTFTAMLLAGGQSRRMGVDKATLTISGEALWRRQLQILGTLQPVALWISARATPPWCPAEVEVILDASPSRGPLSGLVAGLARLQTSHLLVLAIDLPNMSPEHLHKLCHLARPGCGVVPGHAEHFEPLCAIYPIEAAPLAHQALARNELSVQHLARTLISQHHMGVYSILENERPLYHNLNRPSDLDLR